MPITVSGFLCCKPFYANLTKDQSTVTQREELANIPMPRFLIGDLEIPVCEKRKSIHIYCHLLDWNNNNSPPTSMLLTDGFSFLLTYLCMLCSMHKSRSIIPCVLLPAWGVISAENEHMMAWPVNPSSQQQGTCWHYFRHPLSWAHDGALQKWHVHNQHPINDVSIRGCTRHGFEMVGHYKVAITCMLEILLFFFFHVSKVHVFQIKKKNK